MDGLHFCRGEPAESSAWKDVLRGKPDVAGFRHYRRVDDNRHERTGHAPAPPPKPEPDLDNVVKRFSAAMSEERRQDLAKALKLPIGCLDSLAVGWKADEGCWVFPECDGTGRIIGYSRRFTDGTKKNIGRRGLTIPVGWRELPGAVLIVEGASDVLALTACGIAAIGRPSNVGGVDHLAELLRDLPPDRHIIVTGENDARPDGKWPGKAGAEKTAEELTQRLGRSVRITMPPDGIKDCRDWAHDILAGQSEAEDWGAVAATIRGHVAASTEVQIEHRFKLTDSREFLAGDYKLEFIIDGVLVKDQPGVFGGPQKTLKTTTVVDAAVSIATETAFLGKFRVRKRSRVALCSGESGAYTLKETCLRVLEAKGLAASHLDGWLKWEFRLPVLNDPDDMRQFVQRLADLAVDVVFIDPTYLALGLGTDAKSIFDMGRMLRPVAEELAGRAITVILVHHANRQLPIGEVMGLEHLSHVGLAEFDVQEAHGEEQEPPQATDSGIIPTGG